MKSKFTTYTDKILDKISDILAAKITFVAFSFIAFVPLFFQLPHNILEWQQYASQTMIQLIALNVLGYTTRKEGKETKEILEETHTVVMIEMFEMKEIIKELHEIISCFGNFRKDK